MQTLSGHVSQETAYVVEDYPYGFRLRCQIRYWLEFRKGYGFRFVSQTSNPKKPGLIWNKPKAGTYSDLLVMVLNEEGHTQTASPEWPRGEIELNAFAAQYGEAFTPNHVTALRVLYALSNASKRITYTIGAPDDDRPRQTFQEQTAILNAVVHDELRKMDAANPLTN